METKENINMNINNEENSEVKKEAIPQPEMNDEVNYEAKREEYPQNNVNTYDYRYGYPQYQQPNMNNAGPQYNAYGYNNQPQGNYYEYQQPEPQNVNPQGYYGAQNNQNPYNAQNNQQNNPYYQNYYYPQNYYHQPKNRIIAGLFGIIFGGIGLHNFYLGYTGRAIAQLLVTIFTCGIGSIWGFIEGIMIIAGAYKNNVDADGFYTKDI